VFLPTSKNGTKGMNKTKTTIYIPQDIMKMTKSRMKNRAGATFNGTMLDLVRIGFEKEMTLELIDLSEKLEEKINTISNETNKNTTEIMIKKLQTSLVHTLCIARRFAHKDDPELLKTADNDASQLANKG
ncbi:MAG: hypothetical protein ACJATI_005587, partial [Halioglobus sp.]